MKVSTVCQILVLCSSLTIAAPGDEASPLTKEQTQLLADAKKFHAAFSRGDFQTCCSMTYLPDYVKSRTARDEISAIMKEKVRSASAKGITLERIVHGAPSDIILEGDKHVAFLPTDSVYESAGRRIRIVSFLVAVSEDSGLSWRFIDVSDKPNEMSVKLFPTLCKKVKIPKKTISMVE